MRRRAHTSSRLLVLPLAAVLTGSIAVAAPQRAVAAPVPARATTIALPDGIQPEGITSAGNRYFVGSLNDGRIVTGSLTAPGPATVLLPGAPGRQLRGLEVDPRTRLLWAAGNVGSAAHVYAVSIPTGAIMSDTVVPGGVFLNDLAIGRRAVWVTDSGVQRLTRIALDPGGAPAGTAPTFRRLGGDWPGDQGGNSANGIRFLDRDHVVLDHSTAGGLWSVDLRTGSADRIRVRGAVITGGDGLERRGATLWVVRGRTSTSVSQLTLDRTRAGWTATFVRLLSDPSLDVPSTATYAAGALFAVNARFGTPSPGTASYSITRLAV